MAETNLSSMSLPKMPNMAWKCEEPKPIDMVEMDERIEENLLALNRRPENAPGRVFVGSLLQSSHSSVGSLRALSLLAEESSEAHAQPVFRLAQDWSLFPGDKMAALDAGETKSVGTVFVASCGTRITVVNLDQGTKKEFPTFDKYVVRSCKLIGDYLLASCCSTVPGKPPAILGYKVDVEGEEEPPLLMNRAIDGWEDIIGFCTPEPTNDLLLGLVGDSGRRSRVAVYDMHQFEDLSAPADLCFDVDVERWGVVSAVDSITENPDYILGCTERGHVLLWDRRIAGATVAVCQYNLAALPGAELRLAPNITTQGDTILVSTGDGSLCVLDLRQATGSGEQWAPVQCTPCNAMNVAFNEGRWAIAAVATTKGLSYFDIHADDQHPMGGTMARIPDHLNSRPSNALNYHLLACVDDWTVLVASQAGFVDLYKMTFKT